MDSIPWQFWLFLIFCILLVYYIFHGGNTQYEVVGIKPLKNVLGDDHYSHIFDGLAPLDDDRYDTIIPNNNQQDDDFEFVNYKSKGEEMACKALEKIVKR